MKKLLLFIIVILVAGWALQTYSSFKAVDYAKYYWQKIDWAKIKSSFNSQVAADPEKQLNIFIRDGKFIPNLSAANLGIKVTWFNEDTKAHTVTGDGWGSDEIAPGQAYSKVFDVAGDYNYHCALHPSVMGEILIK